MIIELPDKKHNVNDVNEMKNAFLACFVTENEEGNLKIWKCEEIERNTYKNL